MKLPFVSGTVTIVTKKSARDLNTVVILALDLIGLSVVIFVVTIIMTVVQVHFLPGTSFLPLVTDANFFPIPLPANARLHQFFRFHIMDQNTTYHLKFYRSAARLQSYLMVWKILTGILPPRFGKVYSFRDMKLSMLSGSSILNINS